MPEEINWKAPEFEYYEKNFLWFAIAILVCLVLIGISLWQKNFLFSIFLVLAIMMIIIYGKRKPLMIKFSLDGKRLFINNKGYELSSFSGFYIDHDLLVFKRKNYTGIYLKIVIRKENFDKIKTMLQKLLPEIEYKESLTEVISNHIIGF